MRLAIVRSVSLPIAVLGLGLLAAGLLLDPGPASPWLSILGAAALGFALLASERSRAASERRFRTLLEHSQDLLMEVNGAMQISYVSPTLEAATGYASAELVGQNPQSNVHPDDLERVLLQSKSLVERPGEPNSILYRIRCKDGSYIWVEGTATNLLGADEVRSIVVSHRDVTQRVHAEQELRASEKRFRALIEKSTDGIALSSREGAILYVSPSTEKILGWNASELAGLELASLIHPDDSERRRVVAANVRKTAGAVTQAILMRLRHKDGRWIWAEGFVTNLLDEPSVRAIVTNYRDVTERKEMEERLAMHNRELLRSNRELEEFAYVASHDLQEPLRMVASYVQLLDRRYRGKLDANADQYIAFAVDGATRMKRLINDLLDYSRVHREAPREEVALGALVEQALANLGASVRDSGAVVEVGPLPVLRANPTQMLRLFQNLIGNAIKFRREDTEPRIRVHAECDTGTWCVAVEDDGIGIEAGHAEQVFAIFRKLHDKSEYDGTGIGLAVAKKIVEQHGGEIWFESTPGRGTTFHFTLRET